MMPEPIEPCEHTCQDCGKVWSHTAEGAKPIHCIVKNVNHVRCVDCQSKHELAQAKRYHDMLDLPPQTLHHVSEEFKKEEELIRVQDMTLPQIDEHLTALLAEMTILKAKQAAYHAARGRKMQDMSDEERRALYDEHEKRKLARRAAKEVKVAGKAQTAGEKALASLARQNVDMTKMDAMLAAIRARAAEGVKPT